MSRDVTALKDFQQQQVLLRGELSHRIKNILALVHAVASQTLKNDEEMVAAKPAFLARLSALGRAHDILMQSKHAVTSLRAAIDTAIHELPLERISVYGPDVTLGSKSGLAIALAVHELVTNAVKYGALSNEDGRIEISWWREQVGDDHRVGLIWTESGGPVVVAPKRKGFGSRMIDRALASYVQGTTETTYRPEGVLFRLSALEAALAED